MWSSTSKCAQKKAKQPWKIEEPHIQTARQKRTIHDIPDEVEKFDAIVQKTRKKLQFPVEPAVSCATRKRIRTAKTQTQKVAVSKVGSGRPLALSEGRLSDKTGKANKSVIFTKSSHENSISEDCKRKLVEIFFF